MRYLIDFVFGVLRAMVRLTLFAFVSIFVVGLLFIGLCAALLAALWSLLTGRKPAAWTTFVRFRQASRQFQQGVWPGQPAQSAETRPADADIVDVQVKEIRNKPEV